MKISVILIVSFLFSTLIFSQPDSKFFEKKGEVYFKFSIAEKEEINILTRIISIDNVVGNIVYAYANEEEFNEFLSLGYEYEVLRSPGDVDDVQMSSSLEELGLWDSYPPYDAYINMMYQFESDYSSICKVVDAGNTVQGRKILFVKISDNVNERETEPQFMYSSTMHGDETTGFVLMLRLIDSLLSSYGNDTRITNLVNNIEIWINPNANPDGTYHGGNNTVNGATRYNANNKDLNRNFPDPAEGQYPTGPWQPETIAMINLAQQYNFILSANFHGGTEVVNYPWDTWSRFHPDDNWFQFISHKYADTVQAHSPSTYMNGFDDGITNGYAWYRVVGGRQDFFTYFERGRELTIEISDTKLLPASFLPAHWEYNKRSFLNYIESCLFGIRGVVTDTVGNPLKALVKIAGHDFDNSEIFSDSVSGNYHRLIYSGNYNLTFSAPGFFDTIITNVSVNNLSTTILNVELIPESPVPVELVFFSAKVNGNMVSLSCETVSEINNRGFEIERVSSLTSSIQNWIKIGYLNGFGTTTEKNNYSFVDKEIPSGKYLYRLKQIDFDENYKYSQEIEVDVKPVSFSLEQNYPNPFNPTTKIEFSIPEKSYVKVKVFDILGNLVSILKSEELDAGVHKLNFDGSKFSSGIYYYSIETVGFRSVKKMLLLK
ncbi:MAG: hypothetical protein A2V93_00375 [Ignavibacteria bacterium RBG_16_34_14]|nr:MAG: hypothetical protein A2V93_00375 [Ignavibacteria bacterium RBG_16_34_14]